jgi:hypothetical protein
MFYMLLKCYFKYKLFRGRGKRENNGGVEANPDTLYIYIEMSQ